MSRRIFERNQCTLVVQPWRCIQMRDPASTSGVHVLKLPLWKCMMLFQKLKMKWELWCSLVIMPAEEEEENSAQPVWQSILLFGCKGMIEGIIVLLFLWLLLQVLFTKQHEGTVSNLHAHLRCVCQASGRQVVHSVRDFRYKYCSSRLVFTVLLLNRLYAD